MDMKLIDLQYLTHNLCHTYVCATMGVSYAAPAYYADRLCERARCYIREFLTPSQHDRDDMDAQRKNQERAHGLWSPKKYDREVEKKKTRAERDTDRRVLNEKDKVEEALKKYTYDRALKSFDEDVRDPDYHQQGRDQLLKTMYWM